MRIAWGASAGTTVHIPSHALSLQVILSELYSTGFQRSFADDDDLTAIADSDVIYAFQAPPLYGRGGSNAPHSGNHCDEMCIEDDADFPHTCDFLNFFFPRFHIFSSQASLLFLMNFYSHQFAHHFPLSVSPYVSLTAFFTGRHIAAVRRGAVSTVCFVFFVSFCFFMHTKQIRLNAMSECQPGASHCSKQKVCMRHVSLGQAPYEWLIYLEPWEVVRLSLRSRRKTATEELRLLALMEPRYRYEV